MEGGEEAAPAEEPVEEEFDLADVLGEEVGASGSKEELLKRVEQELVGAPCSCMYAWMHVPVLRMQCFLSVQPSAGTMTVIWLAWWDGCGPCLTLPLACWRARLGRSWTRWCHCAAGGGRQEGRGGEGGGGRGRRQKEGQEAEEEG